MGLRPSLSLFESPADPSWTAKSPLGTQDKWAHSVSLCPSRTL